MKILVQNCSSLEFYAPGPRWTANPEEAQVFETSARALEFCHEQRFEDVQIVMKFPQDKYTLRFSISDGCDQTAPPHEG